jgi:hypothetical protein
MVRACRPFLVRFFSVWDDVPERAALAEHVLALRRLADDLGLNRAAHDAAALETLFSILDDWQAVNERIHRAPTSMSSIAFGGLALRLAQSAWSAPPSHDQPRVRVLPAEVARAVDCDQLFILGLGEQSFPELSAGGAIFSESERLGLRDAGLDVRIAADRLPDERLLFLQLIGKPRQSLTLSYSAADRSGIALLRSSFLDAALALFPDSGIPRERRELLIEGFDSDPPLSPAEYRVRWALLEAPSRPERDGDLFDHLRRVETMARARFQSKRFGPFDGLLADRRAIRSESRIQSERAGVIHRLPVSVLHRTGAGSKIAERPRRPGRTRAARASRAPRARSIAPAAPCRRTASTRSALDRRVDPRHRRGRG